MSAAIEEVHKRGLKITGHLCSIGFREAAELGIDDLEHGIVVDTEFTPGKQPDQCPPRQQVTATLRQLDVHSEPVQQMIRTLVQHHVAMTSTLPVFEASVPNGAGGVQRPLEQERVLKVMSSEARKRYLDNRGRISADSPSTQLLKLEEDFEHEFARAGGLLIAGQPVVEIQLETLAYREQLDVRLFDEKPGQGSYLITRGTLTLDTGSPLTPIGATTVAVPTFGNLWQADVGDVLRLEITNVDSPYLTPSRVPSVTRISNVHLSLPIRQATTAAARRVRLSTRAGQ
jgi:hypothetical protein